MLLSEQSGTLGSVESDLSTVIYRTSRAERKARQCYVGTAEHSRWWSGYSKLEPRFHCGGGDSLALPVGLTAREPKTGRRGGLSSPKWPNRQT